MEWLMNANAAQRSSGSPRGDDPNMHRATRLGAGCAAAMGGETDSFVRGDGLRTCREERKRTSDSSTIIPF